MNILMVAPFDSNGRYRGGISSVVNTLCDSGELEKKNIFVTKFNTCRLRRSDAVTGKLGLKNFYNAVLVYKQLPKEAKSVKPDAVYFHTSVKMALLKDLFIIRHFKRKTDIPVVLHIHFAEYEKIMFSDKFRNKIAMNILKKYVDRICFLSSETKKEFIAAGISSEKCSVIYNFSTLEYSDDEIRSGINAIRRFLFVGSIDERKGIFDVLNVLNKTDAPFEIHICGKAPDEATEARFEEYRKKLGNKLKFHGFVYGEEKRDIFRESDVLILYSYGEGAPVVIYEALSAGCGIISTDVGAIPEIVTPQVGILVHPGNSEELSAAIDEYLRMPCDKLENQKSYNHGISFDYTIEAFANHLKNVLDGLKQEQ